MTGACVRACRRGAGWCAGFFSLRAQQSMTRLVALLFAIGAVTVAVICAVKGIEHWKTVTGLAGGGSVALLKRSQPKDVPPIPALGAEEAR